MRKLLTAVALSTLVTTGCSAPTFEGTRAAVSAPVSIAPVADTYVQADFPTTNYGNSVRWSTEGRNSMRRNALLKFDVVVPAGERIVSAKLRAYSEASATATEFVNVYKTTGDWTETGVTWNNAPARGTWLGKTGGFAGSSWVEWDVTAATVAGANNFKLESGAQKWIGFKSDESPDPALRPKLVITTQPTGTTPTTPPPPLTGDGTTAASTQNWGPVVAGDEFNYTGAPDAAKWSVYNSAGHAGKGFRSPAQVTVDGTKAVLTGTPDGTTAGMSAKFANQMYGRWEVRAAGSGDDEYHMVSILWPDSGNWPCDGEVDFAETTGDWNVIKFFNHYSCDNLQTSGSKALDVRQFHNYAVDWSPAGIVGYVDGVKWFEDNAPGHQPPGPMHQTLQLDWFPNSSANGAGEMRVDWVRVHNPATITQPTPTPTPTPPPSTGGSFDFAAVGDMNPSGNTSTTSASGKNASSIKAGLADGTLDNFIGIGDFQYSAGNCTNSSYTGDTFAKWEAAGWGPVKAKTLWTAGPNHDHQPGRNAEFDKWMDGACGSTAKSATSTDPTRTNAKGSGTAAGFQAAHEWYSVDKGNWHILFAPTGAWRYNAIRAQAMTAEIDSNLAAAKARGKHLAVVYHDPYFTSNTSSHSRFTEAKPWIDVFHKNRVKVLLSGSQHNYERTCPVDNADQCTTDGMQQFQVSTGGIGLRAFTSSPAYVQKRFSDTWGHLRMSLNDNGSYTWRFVGVHGGTGTDSGSRR
ncbi:DNRLRE domain-containing protein [Arthrobacter sp. MDT2-2]